MVELRRSSRIQNPSPPSSTEPVAKKAKASDGQSVPKLEKQLEVGDSIPDLVLKNEDDEEVQLSELASKTTYLAIFAYPKASTPGCTRQACGFRDSYESLTLKNVTVVGISADSPSAQKKFITKQNLQYSLLSDPKREFIGLLGAKKTPQSGVTRSHWVFKNGKLAIKKVGISPEASFGEIGSDIDGLEEANGEPEVDDEVKEVLDDKNEEQEEELGQEDDQEFKAEDAEAAGDEAKDEAVNGEELKEEVDDLKAKPEEVESNEKDLRKEEREEGEEVDQEASKDGEA